MDNRDPIANQELRVDEVYEGGREGNAGDDPLPNLLGVSNSGGFRILGTKENPRLIVLTTSMSDPEWPDLLDRETGVFTYYGDNKKPGRDLHETPRYGNLLLRNVFNGLHMGQRELVPPVFIFRSASQWRDMIFIGLAVPGADGLTSMDDLIAVWKTTNGRRFQNYKAKFTILDVPTLSRTWLTSIKANGDWRSTAPIPWIDWVNTGRYRPLRAVRSLEIRKKDEQLPSSVEDKGILKAIVEKFSETPHGFETCAAEIVRLYFGEDLESIDLTRPTRDGGRDAVGRYKIGKGESSLLVDFSMEAKCYGTSNSVGVKELSRLISRLRHRQFGILVTTSWVNSQAYKEIKEDRHPIIIVAGGDVVRILKEKGINSRQTVTSWLDSLDRR